MARPLLSILGSILCCLVLFMAGCSGARPDHKPVPRLVVILSIDQMRGDVYERLGPTFESGLKRVFEDGLHYSDAIHDHSGTGTGPGHATISTGSYPSHHGIISNAWWDREAWKSIYAVDDTVRVVGKPGAQGSSPHFLKRPALGSWLKAAHPEAKVYSVTFKDRSAILMAGHEADGVYWWYDDDGQFVTSTYYTESVPEWVDTFNASGRADRYFAEGWTRLKPESFYGASREDDFPSEGDGRYRTFPHRFPGDKPGLPYYNELRITPFSDELVFEFATELMKRENLGRDEVPDLLFVGASAADGIGHVYGPFSQEMQDHYTRLDLMIGKFLDAVYKHVGKRRVLVVVTSDHGVMPMPEELRRRGIEAKRVNNRDIVSPLLDTLIARTGVQGLRASLAAGVYLRDSRDMGLDMPALRAGLAELLRDHPDVADAYTWEELSNPDTPDRPYLGAFQRSFEPSRGPDVVTRLPEYAIPIPQASGTTHESPYYYDAHIPIVFLETDLEPGKVTRRVRTVDIAPTVARILGIAMPENLDGIVLPEATLPWVVQLAARR